MFSYRTRRAFRRIIGILLTLTLITVAALLCWLLWLQRYILYTPDGVILDFSLSQQLPQGQPAKPLQPGPSIYIQYGREEETKPPEAPTMKKLLGYYVTTEELLEDLAGVQQKLAVLPEGTAVLMDVKSTWGHFFYTTSVGYTIATGFDGEVMRSFFETVNEYGLHTVARVPAFRDYDFARNNTHCGLWAPGGYLWSDADRRYWLDPANETVQTYLIQTAKELRDMGFDEVVFKDFTFPPTDDGIRYEGDRAQALAGCAQTLVKACADDDFTVSFLTNDPGFVLTQTNCRLYLENVMATEVADVLSQYQVPDPSTQIVFFAQVGDTRYEVSGVLRPIDMAI